MLKPMLQRGEIYWVKLDPTIGAETQKTRPCVVLNCIMPMQHEVWLFAPLLKWNERFHGQNSLLFRKIMPNEVNNLDYIRTIDLFQTRAVSTLRLNNISGNLTDEDMDFASNALCYIIGGKRRL